MESYDVVIIGSGPGGYVCAIRCAQLGMKTAIIEKYDTLGGTCLNVGCIPSKALLDSSEHYFNAVHNFKTHGIDLPQAPKVNIKQMIDRKAQVVEDNVKGVDFLMKKNKIEVFHGVGSFKDKNTLKIAVKDGKDQEIGFKNAVIATGSKPNYFPGMEPDKKRIITSTEALELKEVPKKLVIIGGGVIGLELGSVYGRLGAEVSVIEFMDSIIPTMDHTMGKELMKVLKKEGFKFYMQHKVQKVTNKGKSVEVEAEDKDGKKVKFEGDYCLVSVGRKPYTENLGLENVGLKTEKGKIPVNDQLQTSVSNIYAIGDVIRGAMLAHKAEEEGVLVAEEMAGQKPHIDYNCIPNVVYTWPEVAGVGQTEEQLKEKGVEYKVGQFPIRALGRARASMDTQGLVKILADKNTDEILGIHMITARAADLIAEAVVAMEYRASAEDIARISHAHPTYAEAVKEAAMAATDNRSIHS